MPDDDWLELIKIVNSYKDEIKQSSQKIISKINNSDISVDIDKELIEILNSFGKIGTISGNARGINSFAIEWHNCVNGMKAMEGDWGQHDFLKVMLGKICMISFEVKKKWWSKKLEIKLPSIDFNFQKFQ